MRKVYLSCFFIVSLIVMFLSVANAAQFRRDKHIIIPKGEVIEGTLYANCESLTINGTITGDLIAFSYSININGTVQGDFIAYCRNINVNGTVQGDIIANVYKIDVGGIVEGDLRLLVSELFINGTVKENVMAYCRYLLLNTESTIGQDALLHSSEADLKGKILGSLYITADVQLAGTVGKGGNVLGRNKISILPNAHIKGILKVSGRDINIAPEALIEGEIKKIEENNGLIKLLIIRENTPYYIFKLIWLLAAILIGVLAIQFMPRITQEIIVEMQPYWKSTGIGLIALIVTPFVLILIAITLVGLPLSLIGLALYLTLLYLSCITVGIVTGMLILRVFQKPFQVSLAAMVVGLFVLHILFAVPYFGIVVRIITLILGLGMIVSGGFNVIREKTQYS